MLIFRFDGRCATLYELCVCVCDGVSGIHIIIQLGALCIRVNERTFAQHETSSYACQPACRAPHATRRINDVAARVFMA